VEQFEGSIGFESIYGEGSTFTFKMKLGEIPAEALAEIEEVPRFDSHV